MKTYAAEKRAVLKVCPDATLTIGRDGLYYIWPIKEYYRGGCAPIGCGGTIANAWHAAAERCKVVFPKP